MGEATAEIAALKALLATVIGHQAGMTNDPQAHIDLTRANAVENAAMTRVSGDPRMSEAVGRQAVDILNAMFDGMHYERR